MQLESEAVKHVLLLKDIAYTRVQNYWSGVSFLHKTKNKEPFEQAFNEYFITSIAAYKPKKGKKTMDCFQCGRTLQAGASSTAWVNETMPDVKRKTDSFWNYIPDIMMCPFCMLVYACVPLGFTTFANEGVFVNDCRSLKALDRVNCFTDVSDELKNDTFAAVINRFTLTADEKQAKGELQNVQVVRCSSGDYKVNTLTADMLEAFIRLKPTFEKLLKANPRLFHQIIAYVLKGQELYGMMLKGYRDALQRGYSLNVYSLVLTIQIEMFGRKKEKKALETDKNAKWAAYKSGQALRSRISSVSAESGKSKANEKRLVGVTYRLLNALQSSDYRLFMDTIERQYVSLNIDIPLVFLSAVNNDEMLQMVGHAFVQGLNSKVEGGNKEADKRENASAESEG
jgi:CRISPR-associated protein Cst1